MAHPRTMPGGIVIVATGEKSLSTDAMKAGTLAIQSVWDGLAAPLFADEQGAPRSGFIDTAAFVTVASLTASIAPGYGAFYDTTATDVWDAIYTPIVIPASVDQAINAHHSSLARWDLLSIGPDTEDTETENRNIKDPETLVVSTTSVEKLRKTSYALTYTAGTPHATPTTPSTPSGHIAIARLRVPATSGAVLVDDLRPRLAIGNGAASDPREEYASSFVPRASTELQVSAQSTPDMTVLVADGAAYIRGYRHRHGRQSVTITAADPTNPRIDIVAAVSNGTIEVVAGTPAGSPTAPSLSVDQLALASVAVAANETAIESGHITDLRERLPITAAQIRDSAITAVKLAALSVSTAKIQLLAVDTGQIADDAITAQKIDDLAVVEAAIGPSAVATAKIAGGAVTAVKLSVVPAIPTFTYGAESSETIAVAIQCKDCDGVNVARVVRLHCEVLDALGRVSATEADYRVAKGAAGTYASPTTGDDGVAIGYGSYGSVVIDTNSSGLANVTVEDMGGGAGKWLRVTPIGTAGYPAFADLQFTT